jgi:hypothetical protein
MFVEHDCNYARAQKEIYSQQQEELGRERNAHSSVHPSFLPSGRTISCLRSRDADGHQEEGHKCHREINCQSLEAPEGVAIDAEAGSIMKERVAWVKDVM